MSSLTRAKRDGRGAAVIVMARAPSHDEGKTRLRPVLSDEERLRLQEAFLRDAVAVAREASVGPVYVAYTSAGAAPWAKDEFEAGVVAFPQQGDDLGARMLSALRHVTRLGFGPLVMIGTDAPLLQPSHIQAAVRELEQADLCLGPSADGGYYLIACCDVEPKLFTGPPWGTNRVLDSTLRIAAQHGLRCRQIDTLYDVDTPDDLARLREDLARLANEPGFHMPEHTAKALGGLGSLV
ncbi:MAG: TIGR04282 family arsenosugar biosynthesis glycosyltransferase [Chloroflexi bacterium]|nr:TIGR04282 family arsenosugar biosynthesis glycosyltransferase [Chloroflexota bacterium]